MRMWIIWTKKMVWLSLWSESTSHSTCTWLSAITSSTTTMCPRWNLELIIKHKKSLPGGAGGLPSKLPRLSNCYQSQGLQPLQVELDMKTCVNTMKTQIITSQLEVAPLPENALCLIQWMDGSTRWTFNAIIKTIVVLTRGMLKYLYSRLYNGKAAEQELKSLQDQVRIELCVQNIKDPSRPVPVSPLGKTWSSTTLLYSAAGRGRFRSTLLSFCNLTEKTTKSENDSLFSQILPPLVDVIPEARLNLVRIFCVNLQ